MTRVMRLVVRRDAQVPVGTPHQVEQDTGPQLRHPLDRAPLGERQERASHDLAVEVGGVGTDARVQLVDKSSRVGAAVPSAADGNGVAGALLELVSVFGSAETVCSGEFSFSDASAGNTANAAMSDTAAPKDLSIRRRSFPVKTPQRIATPQS